MYQYLFFDLDGTLTDSALGITNAVMYALDRFGVDVPDRSALYRFVGPPLSKSFQKYYGFSEEKADLAVTYFRDYYLDKGMYENKVYDGIEDTLQELKNLGFQLYVATAKPEVTARSILEYLHLEQYFTYMGGATMDKSRTTKSSVIQYVLNTCNITDSSKVLMIGDREDDILGARSQGLYSMGVLYGYGSREELENAGANCIVEHISDIIPSVLTHSQLV